MVGPNLELDDTVGCLFIGVLFSLMCVSLYTTDRD